ncbi:MAG: PAS domain S-box protein, partial [Candidatus Cloacimonetes bacterium]|nr:PAS domain S-box protein [Candidatus Cloacimonadota bacterium]
MKQYRTISQKIQKYLLTIILGFFIIMIFGISSNLSRKFEWWFDKACESKVVDVSHHIKELVEYYDFGSIEGILKLEVEETSELNFLKFNYGSDFKDEFKYGEIDSGPFAEFEIEIEINNEKYGLLLGQFDKSLLIMKKNQFVLTMIIALALLLLVLFFVVKTLLSKLLSKPLINLKNDINEVTKGNFDVELNYTSNDEVGALTDSFKLMMKELQDKNEYTSSLLNSTQAGVALINAETHKIEYVNPVAAEMIGLDENEIVGSICHKFICPSQIGECPISDKDLSVDNSEKVLITASGEELSILKTVKQISIGNKDLLIETFIDITEMKQLQEQISKNEKKYHTMFQNSPASIIMTNADGIIIDINDRVAEWLGYDAKPIIGKRVLELPFLTKQSRRKMVEEYKKRAAGNDRSDYELSFIAKDSRVHIGSVLVNTLRDDQQKIQGEIITILDITDEKNANDQMVKNEKKFKELFENSNDAIFIHTIDDEKILAVNKRAEEVTGYSREELLTMTAIDLSVEETSGDHNSLINNDTLHIETNFKKKDGTIIWVDISARVIDRNENVAQGVVRDITEERRTQQFIKEQEKKFRTMFNSVSDAIYLIKDDKIIDCNTATVKLFGMRSKEEFLNTDPKDLSPYTQPDGSNSYDKIV